VASIRTTSETIAHSGPIGHIEVIIDPNDPFMINALFLNDTADGGASDTRQEAKVLEGTADCPGGTPCGGSAPEAEHGS
jgi:hypothetical protein